MSNPWKQEQEQEITNTNTTEWHEINQEVNEPTHREEQLDRAEQVEEVKVEGNVPVLPFTHSTAPVITAEENGVMFKHTTYRIDVSSSLSN